MTHAKTGTKAPSRGGSNPGRAGLAPHLGVFGAALVLAVTACAGSDADQVTQPAVVGMTDKIAAMYSDGQVSLYQVQTPVRLPLRKPTDAERGALGKADPFPRAPFVTAADLRIEIRFTISNLDDKQHAVELLVDPWNEFVRYRPRVTVGEEEVTPDFSGYDRFYILPPKSRVQGTLNSDDTFELAVDLATAEVLIAKPPPEANLNGMINHLFNLQNRSNAYDPLINPYVPKVVPGMIGFDLGLRSYEPGNIAVEVIVDVQDLQGDRATPPDDNSQQFGVPGRLLSPPPPATMM
ncbi:MAG: hypothetical protein JWM74_6065 [Myxococcaceae bacterium]|nr:hypothetical protein [Myxococcaceae bacterium]